MTDQPVEPTRTAKTRNPCAGLTKAQRAAFERLTVGDNGHIPSRAREALIAKGLVVQTGERSLGTILGRPVMTAVFEVPTSVHMQWCAWCAENVEDAEHG